MPARSWESYQALLRWIDPDHDTSEVRGLVEQLRLAHGHIRCALPFVLNPSDAAEVFEGLTTLRASLRRDQQIEVWEPWG